MKVTSVQAVAAVALALVLWLGRPVATDSVPTLTGVFCAVWVLCLVLVSPSRLGGYRRASTIYMVVFGLFHGGLLIAITLSGGRVPTDDASTWLSQGYLPEAVWLVCIGMTAFAAASAAIGAIGRSGGGVVTEPDAAVPSNHRALGIVGVAVNVFGLSLFLMTLFQAGGLALLGGGYETFLDNAANDLALSWGTSLLATGAIMAVAGGGLPRYAGWAGYLCYAVLAFPLGTRGAVLFPLMALLVLEFRRGLRLRVPWILVGAVVVLTLVGLVRETRVGGTDDTSGFPGPLAGIAELGYSLRPTTVVLDWADSGNPFRDGVTFVAVPLRLFESLTGAGGGPPPVDYRLFNVEIEDRAGPLGASPIAEGFRNFGAAGVVGVMAVLGAAIGGLERLRTTPLRNAVLGVTLLPLFVQIRNDFAPVLSAVIVGLLLVLTAHVVEELSRSRASRVQERSREPRVGEKV